MRDRLIELIESARYWGANTSEELADRLLSEGVIILPCKLGKRVYDISEFIDNHPMPDIYEFLANEVILSQCRETKELIFSIEGVAYTFDEFGKTVFLTREEAEKALKERRE